MATRKEKRQYDKAQRRYSFRLAEGFDPERCKAALAIELEVGGYIRPTLSNPLPFNHDESLQAHMSDMEQLGG